MNRSEIIGRIIRISIISAAIAFSPVLLFASGGGAGGVFLFLWSITVGLVVFFTGIISTMKSYRNSLTDSEKKQMDLKLRNSIPWLILLIIFAWIINAPEEGHGPG